MIGVYLSKIKKTMSVLNKNIMLIIIFTLLICFYHIIMVNNNREVKYESEINTTKMYNELLSIDVVYYKTKDSLHIIENRLIFNYEHPQFDSIIEINKRFAKLQSLRDSEKERVFIKYLSKKVN